MAVLTVECPNATAMSSMAAPCSSDMVAQLWRRHVIGTWGRSNRLQNARNLRATALGSSRHRRPDLTGTSYRSQALKRESRQLELTVRQLGLASRLHDLSAYDM